MEAKAKLSYLRISPKKVRLVADLIRGLKVDQAIIQLDNLNKASSKPLLKLLNSAIANAENNFSLQKDNLYIKEIRVDGAGMIKRWQPRAYGRATMIRKKMSHVYINLAEIKPTADKAKKAKTEKKEKKKEKLTRVSSTEDIKKISQTKEVKANKKEKINKDNKTEKGKEIEDVRMEGKHRHNQNEDKKSMKGDKGFMKKIFNRKSG